MKHLKTFESFEILESNWKWSSFDEAVPVPDGVLKKYIIHTTNIDPLIVYNEGIKPFCSSKSTQWSNYKYPCSVFAVNGYYEIWAQFNTKGAVVIDTTLLQNTKWWYDPGLYSENGELGKLAIVTNESIPPNAIVGILCTRDLINMRGEYHKTKSDKLTQQYLDKIMKENSLVWSYNCKDKQRKK
jgi:hypothetical protein